MVFQREILLCQKKLRPLQSENNGILNLKNYNDVKNL